MLNIALFGAPGAGKGTQSKMLIEKYSLSYIATGDILRQEIAENTEIGREVKDIIEKGGLASDEIIVQILENRIAKDQYSNGILFDGFPRTVVQAYILDGLLMRMNRKLLCMISLEVPREELIRRMLERAEIAGRADDNETVIQTRLREYDEKTIPVADYYKEKGNYIPINGTGSMQHVFQNITGAIEKSLENVWRNIIIYGPPGAGKGTQAMRLAEKYGLVYISTGEMIRNEIEKGTEIGMISKTYIEKANNVPDEIAIKLIERKILENKKAKGFLFKGFPSTLVQAYIMDGLLQKLHTSVTCCIEINSRPTQCMKRLQARSKSPSCRVYDKTPELIIKRLETYEERSPKVIDYYTRQSKFYSVQGDMDKDTVFQNLCETINHALINRS